MSRVAVLGSVNADLVVEVNRRPSAGETLLGSDLRLHAGGKGANQAAAAARVGAETTFVGGVGDDEHAAFLRAELLRAGVDIEMVHTVDRPTGTAMILVTPDGENSIVVSPGANHALDPRFVDLTAQAWLRSDVLVMNLETPLSTVSHAAALAASEDVRVLINAAPATALDAPTLSVCDPVVVNEHEARAILGDGESPFESLARRFLEAGARSAIITLGAAGALVADGCSIDLVPSYSVPVVDTTGAGDAFVGAIACELARGASLRDAVHFATAVAAISVQRRGSQSSYPNRREVDAFVATRGQEGIDL